MVSSRILNNDPKALLLKAAIDSYAPLEESTWNKLFEACSIKSLRKGEYLVSMGSLTKHLYFVCKGLFRAFTTSEDGKEYTKLFFQENTFPASVRSLLNREPSTFAIQALEDSIVIAIDYNRYRSLLRDRGDLKWFHIRYLEVNWVLSKEPFEVGLALDDARTRYKRFVRENFELVDRIPLVHIASRLGMTPTQLSRIRKKKSDLDTSE